MGYDPNEPRDAIGRWTDSLRTAIHSTASDRIKLAKSAMHRKIDSQKHYAKKDVDGKVIKDKDGNIVYDEQRATLHEKIVDKYLSNGTPQDKPIAQLIGGAPANGKSTLLESGAFDTPPNDVKINPDDIKADLPEYNPLISQREKKAAAFVHEESSDISKVLQRAAIKMKSNVTADQVFDNGFETAAKKLKAFKEAGYYVKMDYVSLDTDLSKKLADLRYKSTGRYVVSAFLKHANNDIPNTFQKLAKSGLPDELRLWDTNVNKKPRLIAEAIGGNIKIHDEKLWQDFLAKEKHKSTGKQL